MSELEIKKFYNDNAAVINNNYQPYNTVVLDSRPEQHFIRLFSFAELKDKSKVLDIGCGCGLLLKKIQKNFKNCDLTGLDLSENQLKYINNIKTKVGNIEEINIDEKFDFIFCMEVIGYANNQFKTIDKILSMLNPNGIFICSSFICQETDTWQEDIKKFNLQKINKEDAYYYKQIPLEHLKKYNIEIYDDSKIMNFYYLNFAERRGLFWKRQDLFKKHILFKIKNQ